MENYEQIFYLDCPRFTVGHVDQWSERGYLLFGGKVYWYEIDRKEQCDSVRSPVSVEEFLDYAKKSELTVPESFLSALAEIPGSGPRDCKLR